MGPDVEVQGRWVNLPGGRDRDGRPIITVHIPLDSSCSDLSDPLKYILGVFSDVTRKRGFTIIVDARKGAWRVARACIRQVNSTLCKEELAQFLVLRPDAFWDKQRVENCTSTQKDGQVIFVPRNRLHKYVDLSQLPIELGGNFIFNSDQWFDTRTKADEFLHESVSCSRNLDEVQQRISNLYKLSASQIQTNHASEIEKLNILIITTNNCIDKGKDIIKRIEYNDRNRKLASETDSMPTPQDALDTIERLDIRLEALKTGLISIEQTKRSLTKTYFDTKDLHHLEEGIVRVTNWILGPAESLLKSRHKVGYDVSSAEELRREHEGIELQCWNAYGAYAELVHKIDNFSGSDFLTVQQKDLISQKDFMDFVCRSFATRLERRRNILITSLRFFRLVSEYFDRTGEVFDSLVMGNKIGDFATAGQKLKELQENQSTLDCVERELVKEGEKLSDMLSMPIKDALGREVLADYSEDIINIRDILNATTARKNIFGDSVELQKLTLEQVTHIYQYEKDAAQALEWLDELFQVLLKHHGHVGCTVYEIQAQKDEHQMFQETAKCTFNYGYQLLGAAAALRCSCKIQMEENEQLGMGLRNSWERLLNVSQEQMTRLRVSAVFHRSVEEQCNQLRDLREAVATIPLMDINRKRARVKHYLGVRERLMVEVGRMVRLGRLLRSRLRDALHLDETMSEATARSDSDHAECENATAVEAVSERLTEVTNLAEELDQTLKSAQQDCAISPAATTLPIPIAGAHRKDHQDEETCHSVRYMRAEDGKSDDEFLTASDCTLQHSRSSSYNTASDCEHLYAPWWDYGKDDCRDDLAKEKMVLAVGLPELPIASSVLRPSPEVPPGKIAREVTETTHIKVQQCHTFGVKSFVLTSETVREKGELKETAPLEQTPVYEEDDFASKLKEVGWKGCKYKQALRSCI
ncbi:PREDICTED: SEC14 domain and spectrin repeat-containing protein 1-B [Nicrophorus vespilloides]|uniref:SEC14 domain and spectrin repeat-containing protein 1-B n=1 Tax=Nicrophorus vespilloides TaxID=110193 RepID=A0ABM1N3B1_NICVS|nr:PREDICTED: SEC14 domain and spectrin repeat-containing protein 1-B [Nicrophorus vespilloides]